jgi:hypothetical protein
MDDQTIATMNDAEFDALVDRFIERGEDQVTPQTFLQVLTDVAEQRSQHEVELSGRVVNGEIIFDLPARTLARRDSQRRRMPARRGRRSQNYCGRASA